MFPSLPRSVSLAGLARNGGEPWAGGPREAIRWAAACGFRHVQLDGASVRACDLDRSARRDLAATLRREGLMLSGLDLWVPPAHLVNAAEQSRAVEALIGAADLASELAGLLRNAGASEGARAVAMVSTALHAKTPPELLRELAAGFERVGAVLADHAWPAREATPPIGVGVDPAAIIASKGEVLGDVSRLAGTPVTARLSDFAGSTRVAPGDGSLDVAAYEAVVATRGVRGALVVDLRGLRDQAAAARSMV